MEGTALLEMRGVSKRFPGVVALDKVDFSVARGEVHALMGENGAGKSTLIKVLTGIYARDGGTVMMDDRPINPRSAGEAQELGISAIYQELNLIPQLSVAENLFLGRQPRRGGLIHWREIHRQAATVLGGLGIRVDVRQKLITCSTAVQQMVAIARAVSMDAKLLIMDEPTSSLGENEVAVLFDIVRRVRAQGISTVFITHRLDEIFAICDRVTVLRDGKLVETRPVQGLDKLALVSSMIGRDAGKVIGRRTRPVQDGERETLFETRDLRRGVRVQGIDLQIGRGEVVGMAGLLGAGRTEYARCVFAADRPEAGEILIEGEHRSIRVPRAAIRSGIAFVSEDRKVEGIVPGLTVRENLTLAVLPEYTRFGLVQRAKEEELVRGYVERLRIKTPSPEQTIRNLSGGNQQKVILARWMAASPRLLILDEPTRGIDVGAKAEIEALIQEMAAAGIGILLISSEIEELVRNCDRIAVIQDGRKVRELSGDEISQDAIVRALATHRQPAERGERGGEGDQV